MVCASAHRVSVDEVAEQLVAATDAWVREPQHAAGLCGALFSPRTRDAITALESSGAPCYGTSALRPSDLPPRPHGDPLLGPTRPLRLPPPAGVPGPWPSSSRRPLEEALVQATSDARNHGAIASYAYTTDATFADRVEEAFFSAGASVGLNLHRQLPINYAAAYSDFVTGLNPAGTACLTDLAFVTQRFRVVQSKRERPQEPHEPP